MSNDDGGLAQRLVKAIRYSCNGLQKAWQTEQAFRYEFYVLLIALPSAWLLGKGALERALLMGSCLLVVIVELINSALEAVVDRIGTERHELSGRAKDFGSAAVFCSVILAVIVWAILLTDRWLQ